MLAGHAEQDDEDAEREHCARVRGSERRDGIESVHGDYARDIVVRALASRLGLGGSELALDLSTNVALFLYKIRC